MHFSTSTIAALLSSCSSNAFSAMWFLTSSSLMITTSSSIVRATAGSDDDNDGDNIQLPRRRLAIPTNNEHNEIILDDKDDNNGKDINVDAGILSSSLTSSSIGLDAALVATTLARPSPAEVCGTAGFVDCDNGLVRGTSKTCAQECGDKCCVGDKACDGFTGKVCRDGSCTGYRACTSATIPWVVNSCKGGREVCLKAGYDQGVIANMVNSCVGGALTCTFLGGENGMVGEIRDSCFGDEACYYLAYGPGKVVGNVINSCRAHFACCAVADTYYYTLNQGDIMNICNEKECCFKANSTLTEDTTCSGDDIFLTSKK